MLLDGGFSSMRDRFDWRTAKAVLSPPAFGGIPVEAFVAGIPEHTGLARTPAIEAVVLSLVRVDGMGRVHPRLARANHLRILLARAKVEAARRVRAIGPTVAFEWIEGIHDLPLQRPDAVARRIARFAGDA
jgi:hypothetical protein